MFKFKKLSSKSCKGTNNAFCTSFQGHTIYGFIVGKGYLSYLAKSAIYNSLNNKKLLLHQINIYTVM